ncbi:MAG TPA: group II intron reverse transcriptase/maturase [Gemmatimonadales bacterium]|nr:group II intron reverse transcriptase/maturase [Gemmatimonadales bacterium]
MTRRPDEDSSQPTLWAFLDGEAVQLPDPEEEPSPAPASTTPHSHPTRDEALWRRAFSQYNLRRASAQVVANHGAPGPDGMTVEELPDHLDAHWPEIRQSLDQGTYRPAPVRRVFIPKPDGRRRELGVPTAVDRVICQAIAQVLIPIFDPTFSESSFGFRPKRSQHMAVEAARRHIADGYGWVVDLDLDSFFDRVNHDALMARVARKVGNRALLKLIRRYLEAGVMIDGVQVEANEEGTPQGSPLSPLLSNIMLDDLDKELERRGHRFVRYADDVRIYVRSERAAQRVLETVSAFVEGVLKLKVNRAKSGIALATKRGLLGFGFLRRNGRTDIRIDYKAKTALKGRIRGLTARNWGISMDERVAILNRFIGGWTAYFALADTPSVFDEFDEWLRRRLRQVYWKQWKRPKTRARKLRSHGIGAAQAHQWASTAKGTWRMARSVPLQRALPKAHFVSLGLVGFTASYQRVRAVWRTA